MKDLKFGFVCILYSHKKYVHLTPLCMCKVQTKTKLSEDASYTDKRIGQIESEANILNKKRYIGHIGRQTAKETSEEES